MTNKTQNNRAPCSNFSYVKYTEFFNPLPPPNRAQERPQSLPEKVEKLVKPEKPAKPKSGSSLDLWFDWYHAMHTAGYATALKEIAQETGYSQGFIRQKHALYMKEKGLAKPFKRHNQK